MKPYDDLQVIRKIIEARFVERATYQEIADYLGDLGIAPPRSPNGKWNLSTIRNIIKRETR